MTLIAGRYQPLDTGRPGTAQRARDLHTAQTVLLRDMALPLDGGAIALERAQAAQQIFHPSLITLFNVVPQPEHRILLAYEFVPSHTIAQVSGGHPFHAKRAAEIVTEIADAVAELHSRGITHGGISQRTVLITMKGKAKLDRVGDPSLPVMGDGEVADLTALADVLANIVGHPPGGIPGMQAIETVVERARGGKFESAATFAAMLRRVSD